MTTLLLVRHGITDWNRLGLALGHSDIPLSDEGRQQALSIAKKLARLALIAVYSSDLIRATDTAYQIALVHDLDVTVDAAFRELNEGEWEGLSEKEIKSKWPREWTARFEGVRPGGESFVQVTARSLCGVKRVVHEHPSGVVAIVSHQSTIRCIVGAALKYEVRELAEIQGLRPAEVIRLEASVEGDRLALSHVGPLH